MKLKLHKAIAHKASVALIAGAALLAALLLACPQNGEDPPDPGPSDWQTEANKRIEQHRKETVTFTVTKNGAPVSNAEITVKMTNHEFLFGAAYFMDTEAFTEKWLGLFNYATMWHTWAACQPRQNQFDRTYRNQQTWVANLAANNVRINTGALLSHSDTPAWVNGLNLGTREDPVCDEAVDADMIHVKQDVIDYSAMAPGLYNYFVVINETSNWGTSLGQGNPMGDMILYRWKYRNEAINLDKLARMGFMAAREGNPNAVLLFNDFAIDGTTYINRLRKVTVDGTPTTQGGEPLYDAVGLQAHMHGGNWSAEKIWNVCERYSEFNKPIHITELTIVSNEELPTLSWADGVPTPPVGGWQSTPAGEQMQLDQAILTYTILFSHPLVEAITWWDLSDEGAWNRTPNGLIYKDMTPKPAYTALKKLIWETWTTNTAVTTGGDGKASLRAFRGDYQFTVKLSDGTQKEFTGKVAKNGAPISLEM